LPDEESRDSGGHRCLAARELTDLGIVVPIPVLKRLPMLAK